MPTTPSCQRWVPFKLMKRFVYAFPSYRVVELWREDLAKTNAKAAQSLADPTEYENLFPELKQALQAEEFLKRERGSLLPAATFTSVPVSQSISQSLSVCLSICLSLSLPPPPPFLNLSFFSLSLPHLPFPLPLCA